MQNECKLVERGEGQSLVLIQNNYVCKDMILYVALTTDPHELSTALFSEVDTGVVVFHALTGGVLNAFTDE